MKQTKIMIGDWEFDTATHELNNGETRQPLENRQAQLLAFLVENAGRDISKSELLELWQPRVVNEDALYVCIANLRKALGDEPRSPRYIKTLPGFGYRLVASVGSVANAPDIPLAAKPNRAISLAGGVACVALVLVAITTLWPVPQPDRLVTPPATVADDYQRARYLLSKGPEHQEAALAILRDIMVRAPSFADVYALAAYHQGYTLHGAQVSSQAVAEVNAWIDHALSVDPKQQEAHLAKANLLFSREWNFTAARHHYEQALGSAASYFHYSQFLLAMGDFERALEYSYKYQDLDPQGYSRGSVAWIRAMTGDHESALEMIDELHALEPENAYFQVCRQMIFALSGRERDAFEELRWLMHHAGYDDADLENADLAFGQKRLAGVYNWLLNDPKRFDIGHYAPPLSLARYAVQAGEHLQALQYLKQAMDERQVELLWVAVDPLYRPLHGHPMFEALIRDLGLKSGATGAVAAPGRSL